MGYVDVADQQVWHEVWGEPAGDPVVLLHGGFAGADSWTAQVPALVAAGYRVYAPERVGHAHTADHPGPFSYAAMAADTIRYLDQVVAAPAHLVGWSDGAVIAMLVAIDRPDLARRMVVFGQYYNPDGRLAAGIEQLLRSNPDLAKSFLRRGYDPYSPDGPEHFEIVYDKMLAMIEVEPDIPLSRLAAITSPTLVVQGDRDDVLLEHSAAVVAAMPEARLAVLPGSHGLPAEWPEVVNPLLVGFLGGGPPPPAFELD